jgi:hypothetical protein
VGVWSGRENLIPDFDEHGYLPPGVHTATIQEIAERFGWQSELRQVQMESLHWLLEAARRAPILRIIVNGSFTTNCIEPNDVDCVLLLDPGFSTGIKAVFEALEDIPFLQVLVLNQIAFDRVVTKIFGTDRRNIAKGVIEVTSWN